MNNTIFASHYLSIYLNESIAIHLVPPYPHSPWRTKWHQLQSPPSQPSTVQWA